MLDDTMLEAEEKMEKALEVAREEFSNIRTGRLSAGLFNKIMVDYYGAPTPLQQLASVQIPDARTVLVTPYDRSSLGAVEKALRDSDLGLNPSNDGVVIRGIMPALTQERRKEYIKLANRKGEDAKVSVRSVRRHAKDAIDKAVKDGEVGEDEGARYEKDLEALTKKFVEKVDTLLKGKEAELLEV
ncbi:ribosome recycling factor [Dermatophilus congolensis]|nr:ribosome recycling factor [Dermatophilus congolensis]MBO3128852.1 ribosome recycling factor [Dermatophilus congolensis]MBO3132510.1 ribosome recycling factor [Dermatophilus congolensis]MBO3133329.1 ribosome recycling factor [Dermatophilus congolensis]MBO3135564.1 ribosome recycling factor [Dermatophilus congolensis]MBO3137803.1 ribosome recycling factor [Dermatophilus congolensis]